MKKIILENYLAKIQNDNLQEAGALAILGGVYSTAMIMKYGAELAKEYLTKAGKECSMLSGASKNLCIVDFKLRALDIEISTLKKEKHRCAKARKPDECHFKIDQKILTINKKYRDLTNHKSIFAQKVKEEQNKKNKVM